MDVGRSSYATCNSIEALGRVFSVEASHVTRKLTAASAVQSRTTCQRHKSTSLHSCETLIPWYLANCGKRWSDWGATGYKRSTTVLSPLRGTLYQGIQSVSYLSSSRQHLTSRRSQAFGGGLVPSAGPRPPTDWLPPNSISGWNLLSRLGFRVRDRCSRWLDARAVAGRGGSARRHPSRRGMINCSRLASRYLARPTAFLEDAAGFTSLAPRPALLPSFD